MAVNDPVGELVEGKSAEYAESTVSKGCGLNNAQKRVHAWAGFTVFAYRKHKFNDKNLYFSLVSQKGDSGNCILEAYSLDGLFDLGDNNYKIRHLQLDCRVTSDKYVFRTTKTMNDNIPNFKSGGKVSLVCYDTNGLGSGKSYYGGRIDFVIENLDPPEDGDDGTMNNLKNFGGGMKYVVQIEDTGWATIDGFTGDRNWYTSKTTSNLMIFYPPYRQLPKPNGGVQLPEPKPVGSTSGGPDVSDTSLILEAKSKYKISKVGLNQQVEWSPTTTTGSYNEPITNKAVIQNVGEFSTSPASFNTPSPEANTYTAYVERYYTNYPDILARSNTLTLFTYSKPSLSSISLSKTVISPRSGAGLRVSLYDMNNKTHNFENTFRTCIWSDYKSPYLDYETSSSSKDLTSDDIKAMFPDSKASNGEINSQVKVKRKNLGISGGNPGNGNLVYETETRTKNLKIQYKPTVPIDPNKEPNPNDEGNSGIAYYKKEDNREGVKLTAGHTWVLPNTYDISRMNGVNVRLQYPKTDASGVLSGYRIRLYSPNDGSPDSNVKYFEDHWNTTNYIDTYFVSYDTLRRGISGNEIEITPYYTSSSGEKWYGPTMRKKFVDISWMLNKPVIDCPLTNTTWHNHKYRILFKLPVDRDTNYKGINDIELHYGSGKYRYQEIQMNINGTITTFADNGFYNAHNIWNSPVNVSNANLTYLRTIIVNPSLIGTYSDKNQYIISIRIRKAYGQNPNWDGWGEWSDTITVNRKTVKNDVVNRHEYINATHYMTVQTAFNLSTACYAKKASDNSNFVVKESFDRARGDNINGPHLSPPENQPFQTIREYLSEFKDLHQLKNKINSYATFDTDKNRNPVKLDYQNNLLASFTPIQEFITAAKDQNGATECDSPATILKGRNYMKYMCDEINHLY